MSWALFFDPSTSGRLCAALLHSLWQAALLALVVAAIGRLWRKLSVEALYLIHVAALIVCAAAVPTTFWLLPADGSPAAPSPARALVAQADAPPGQLRPASAEPTPLQPPNRHPAISSAPAAGDAPQTYQTGATWRRIVPYAVGFYSAGVALMLLRLILGLAGAERLRRRSAPVDAGPAIVAWRLAVRRWRSRTLPILAQSERVLVPTLVGLLKPTILLPASALAGLSPSELELILAHELAHVRRHDLWVSLLQRLAETALFFNPPLWYLSRRISTLREFCCDELACRSRQGASVAVRVDYAAALLRMVELARPSLAVHNELAALAATGRSPSELRRRIARLLGEPVREPLRASRGGLLAVACTAVAISVGIAWGEPNKQSTDQPAENLANTLPPPTETDRIVAAARARTFGLQIVPRISIRETYWNGQIDAKSQPADASLQSLWQARGLPVDETMRRKTTTAVTLAWAGPQLLVQTDTSMQVDASTPPGLYTQCRYWDGANGWLGELSPKTRHIYRYAAIEKIMADIPPFYFPGWEGNAGRLPWGGATLLLEEHEIAPEQTRYEPDGAETIDGVECDVYIGPARYERLWIERPAGRIKAISRQYLHETLPNYLTELVREVAGRTFQDEREYRTWFQQQPAETQRRLSAHYAAAHWPLTKPGNLTVFNDYREIAPGVHWPMRAERVVVHSAGPGERTGNRFYRSESQVTDVAEDFNIRQLAAAGLPREGDPMTDRTSDAPVDYVWSSSQSPEVVAALRQAKLEEQRIAKEKDRRINDTPIDSVAAAIHVLTEGPSTDPAQVWVRAIKFLVDHQEEALPALIEQLDREQRDHPISKLAFALRAIGDPRAVPALIRALPRTLLPPRSDYGLLLKDADDDLIRFAQTHDLYDRTNGSSAYFGYGRAFREVALTLQKLTKQDLGEMELNFVHLDDSPTRHDLQREQFHIVARRWADWWEANWQTMLDDPAYAQVNLAPLAAAKPPSAGRGEPPAGPGVNLQEGRSGWIIQSAHDSRKRCFVDLDTRREGGWPASLPPLKEIGADSPKLLAWARQEGFDLMGVTFTPPGESEPLYCLQPLDMPAWKITPQEHRRLPQAMAGAEPYPLARPVNVMIPQRTVTPPYDHEYGGDSFLFVTREGTAGIIRMTAQVPEANAAVGAAYSADDQFLPSGFYPGAKVAFAAMTEAAESPSAPTPSEAKPANAPAPKSNPPKAENDAAKGASLRPREHQLKVIVVDDAGRPIEGAKVFQNHVYLPPEASTNGKQPKIKNRRYLTSGAGEVTLTWPGDSVDLRIWVSHPGRVPLHAMWAKTFQSDGDQIPKEFRFVMKSGTTIGGVVKDESGRPIAGAEIEIENASATIPIPAGRTPSVRPVPAQWLAEGESSIETDAEGRWSASNIPSDLDLSADKRAESPRRPSKFSERPLRLQVSHADFITFNGRSPEMVKNVPALAELRKQEGVVVLKPKASTAAVQP